jgi:hypothetical protein
LFVTVCFYAERTLEQVVTSVLTNDKNTGTQATFANVTLVASSKAGLMLNAATGEVRSGASVGAGTHTSLYCVYSTTMPSCDEALVAAFVPATLILATNDSDFVLNRSAGIGRATTSNGFRLLREEAGQRLASL